MKRIAREQHERGLVQPVLTRTPGFGTTALRALLLLLLLPLTSENVHARVLVGHVTCACCCWCRFHQLCTRCGQAAFCTQDTDLMCVALLVMPRQAMAKPSASAFNLTALALALCGLEAAAVEELLGWVRGGFPGGDR